MAVCRRQALRDRDHWGQYIFFVSMYESKEKTAIVLAAWAFGLPIVFLYGGSSEI